MKFHAIDAQGKVWIQRVETKPAWQPSDKGRVIYVNDDKMFYYASDEKWLKSAGSGFNPRYINDDYTAEDQDLCLVDSRNKSIIITLPSDPKNGSEIKIVDIAGCFESHPCTLHRNGNVIQRLEKNLVLDINDFCGTVTYDKFGIGGWKVSIEGVSQVVGNATLFVNKHSIIAENIDGEGGQKQFTFPFQYNTMKDNISVKVNGIEFDETEFEKTNPNSITFNESIPAGHVVKVVSIPIEGGFNIDRFANKADLDNYLLLSDFTAENILDNLKLIDGAGSGLDADLLDGRSGESFVYIEDYEDQDILDKVKNVAGSGSGLDADLLDGYHASSNTSDRNNKIPVTRSNGTLDPLWLPFGRGGIEFVNSFEIPAGNPTVIDITDLDNAAGYIIQLLNITPLNENVKMYLRVFDETNNAWTTLPSWTVHYSNHLTGVLRDFNTNSDMMLADGVGSSIYGLNGTILITGFSRDDIDRTKTIKSDLTFLSSIDNYASLYQGVGAISKNSTKYTGIRLYFNNGNFAQTGSINILKINDSSL